MRGPVRVARRVQTRPPLAKPSDCRARRRLTTLAPTQRTASNTLQMASATTRPTSNATADDTASSNAHSSATSNLRFVVAIDFGTSHSGFAYSHKANEKTIEALYNWDSAPQPYSKTLSALLYDGNNTPIAWGFSAQQKYMRLAPALRQQHKLVMRFKLFLDESYEEPLPEGLNSIALIGDYLRFMKEKIREVLSVKFGASFSLDQVQWCLTVPAMWSDRAKFHTRKAAAYAGIIDEPTSLKLQIILEPEAAALFVSNHVTGALQDKDVFMVLDAGGGTVDLTVHQVKIDSNTRPVFIEVAPGLGKTCGSTFVDDQFLSYFRDKIGHDAFDRARQEKPEDILTVLKNWEPIKRSFKGAGYYQLGTDASTSGNSEERESISIPNKVYGWMSDERKQQLGDEQDGFDDAVMISPKQMEVFFEPVVVEIQALVDEMLSRCGDSSNETNNFVKVNKIMCVGGFSESQYLVRIIREKYEPRNIKVICPADPGATVVKGAVTYGLNPNAIVSRRSRLTYGLAVRGYWSDSFPENKRSWDEYQRCWMVEDKFDILVAMGDEVAIDQSVKRTYYPPAIWSQSIRLSMYGSKLKAPRFVDEKDCFQLAEVTIPLVLDQEKSINDYPIAISVNFGATEITIQARNTRTHEKFNITVNYNTKSAQQQESSTNAQTKSTPTTANNNNSSSNGVDRSVPAKKRRVEPN